MGCSPTQTQQASLPVGLRGLVSAWSRGAGNGWHKIWSNLDLVHWSTDPESKINGLQNGLHLTFVVHLQVDLAMVCEGQTHGFLHSGWVSAGWSWFRFSDGWPPEIWARNILESTEPLGSWKMMFFGFLNFGFEVSFMWFWCAEPFEFPWDGGQTPASEVLAGTGGPRSIESHWVLNFVLRSTKIGCFPNVSF